MIAAPRAFWVAMAMALPACAATARTLADERLHCPMDKIRFEPHRQTTLIEGCERDDVLGLTNEKAYSWSSLRERAGQDFSCDPQELAIDMVDDATFVVDGCGHKATYRWVLREGFVPDAVAKR
jgi:hypothetical protein